MIAIAGTIALGWNPAPIAFSMGPAKVALIGSSLIRKAVPFKFVKDGLLGDGRPHLRIGVPSLTESEAIDAVDHALDEHADLVFLEANVFAIDLKARDGAGPGWSLQAWWTSSVATKFRRGLDRLHGKNYALNLARDHGLKTIFKPNQSVLAALYPLHLRDVADPDGFAGTVAKARQLDARLILVVPPRSDAAEDFMGVENRAAVQSAFEQLAATYGLELWVFGPAWPNELFADNAHLNRHGRERFVRELRQRYEGAS